MSLVIWKMESVLSCENLESLLKTREAKLSCGFIRSQYTEHIYLEQMDHFAGLSKSTLRRAFTNTKEIPPIVIYCLSTSQKPKSY
ncbi:Uncharacterised protein [uncultured Blautia sp.]|nr:Uncharacterised protein [uncultured Blautia sp.]